MHPRSRFAGGYDFPRLVARTPALGRFVGTAKHRELSIDFADPEAVLALNQALVRDTYGLDWGIPRGALCPPVPGRADYVHALADLLGGQTDAEIPRGPGTLVLDIGTGASAIYPLIGVSEYGWRFVATDIDQASVAWAARLVRSNAVLSGLVECRRQSSASHVFTGVVKPGEAFAASMCNPPFHASAAEAAKESRRKRRNLRLPRTAAALNFGGRPGELWCRGGELGFITRMIEESARMPGLCGWFTTLVAKSEHLRPLRHVLARVQADEVHSVDMAQGNKASRLLAWRWHADTQGQPRAPRSDR